MTTYGIIQGRLSPMIDGKIQCFPWGYWEKEFETAKEIGLDSIEFIFETDRYQENPLWTDEGIEKLSSIIADTGVGIDYICADYFMEQPFIRVSDEKRDETFGILLKLMEQVHKLGGVKGIELPMVDNSKIDTPEEMDVVVETLKKLVPYMEKYNLEIGLESSLPPQDLKQLMERLDHKLFSVTYDIGNSSSLGYDTVEEITTLAPWLRNVHVKDRILHGTTVQLGTGDADLPKSFQTFKQIGYTGPFVLQAARDGESVENSQKQLAYVKDLVEKYMS